MKKPVKPAKKPTKKPTTWVGIEPKKPARKVAVKPVARVVLPRAAPPQRTDILGLLDKLASEIEILESNHFTDEAHHNMARDAADKCEALMHRLRAIEATR